MSVRRTATPAAPAAAPVSLASHEDRLKASLQLLQKQKDTKAGAYAGDEQSTRPFFTSEDFETWKALVLHSLGQQESPVHAIVDTGCLPIFSIKSKQWFGVTAALRYQGQRVPRDTPPDKRNRQFLGDLLRCNRFMVPSEQHVLCGMNRGPFFVMFLTDLLVDDDPEVHSRLYINNLYPRTQESLPWLRGGDLLYASAILFALINVRYMSVCEGPGVRNIEMAARETRPGYFYYNKTILVPAQSVEADISFEFWKHDEYEDYDNVNRVFRARQRAPESIMKCWLWDKSASFREPS